MKTNNEAKRTPGPWFIDPLYPLSIMAPDGDAEPWIVATVDKWCNGENEDCDANAAYIVEACNNYEAVKAQRDEVAAVLKVIIQEADGGWLRESPIAKKARAALAKLETKGEL